MRVTPSLPQRGRHPKGNIPLTPGFHLFFLGFFYHFFGIYHNPGMPYGGSREFGYPGFSKSA